MVLRSATLILATIVALPVKAGGASADVGVTIVAPTASAADVANATLSNDNLWVLTLPSAEGGTKRESMTLTPVGTGGRPITFTTNNATPLTAPIKKLATSGGSLSVDGMLGGQSVHLDITHTPQDGKGQVHAVVAYN